MEGRRDKEAEGPNQGNRRRSNSALGTNWFKKSSHKVTGTSEADAAASPRRKNSTGSIFSAHSREEDEPGTEGMAELSRSRSSSQSRSGIRNIIEPFARFGSPFEEFEKRHEHKKPHEATTASGTKVSPATLHTDGGKPPPACAQPDAPQKHVTLGDLKKHRIDTRAVGFAASVFTTDPPQRIPPVQPVQGCLEFLDNGESHVRKKSKFHMAGEPTFLQEKHVEVSRLAQAKAKENADRSHNSIVSLNTTTSNGAGSSFFGHRTAIVDDEEPETHHMHSKNVDGTVPEDADWSTPPAERSASPVNSLSDGDPAAIDAHKVKNATTAEASPPPDEIYTRCCHLREIMPIRNILRQSKCQLVPIPRVRVANTKPTLVEIQAFSDFLTAVPVASSILDNHISTDEMIRLILVGISRSRDIARLSSINTQLSSLGWQYSCSFSASSRKSSLVSSLACTNPTAVPQRVSAFDRRNADWGSSSEASTTMGCLEELDSGGTQIDFASMQMSLEGGFKSGKKSSLANNQLNHHDVSYIVDWANRPGSCLMGIDSSGNDLSHEEDWQLVQSFLTNPRILELTLRRAKLSQIHASRIVKAITPSQASQSKLRRLDLSGNPELFPSIIDRLAAVIHRFPCLSESELEDCGSNNDNIVVSCEASSHCHRLVHVSFNGNCTLNETAATASCVAVNSSHSICTVEADIPEKFTVSRNQLARYCSHNLERNAGASGGTAEPAAAAEDENPEISSFHDELRSVARAINEPNKAESFSSEELITRIDQSRSRIKIRMQSLLRKRMNGPSSVTDRETTVRLFFFGSTLDRLKSEISGLDPADQSGAEEKVNKVDIREERPSLARQESLNSLKRLEREEAASHRKYADQFIHTGENDLIDQVDKLKVGDLGKIIGE